MQQNFEERWNKLEEFLKERLDKMPDTQAILYLIGINEYKGRVPKIKFSKEQKQELMHVGLCTLLTQEGYYQFTHYDEEGWPHYKALKQVDAQEFETQDALIKELILNYFDIA